MPEVTLYELAHHQVAKFKEVFSLFDINGDGSITANELAFVMESLGQNPTREESHDVINEIDIDGNGAIDFSEFLTMMASHTNEGAFHLEIKEAFKVFDQTNSGYITSSNLKNVLNSLGENLTEEEVEELIREADLDGDGRVDFQEFEKMMSK